jgi:hypothetical protein
VKVDARYRDAGLVGPAIGPVQRGSSAAWAWICSRVWATDANAAAAFVARAGETLMNFPGRIWMRFMARAGKQAKQHTAVTALAATMQPPSLAKDGDYMAESNLAVDEQLHALASATAYANASLALEGLVVDADQAARQKRVIRGELKIAAAIGHAIGTAREARVVS